MALIDSLVARAQRLIDPSGTGWLNRLLVPRRPPPVSDGFYLVPAQRFELGRLLTQMVALSGRSPRGALTPMLRRWRAHPDFYLILKRAEAGRCVEPYLGGSILYVLTDEAGRQIAAGTKSYRKIGYADLASPPARYFYGRFVEALERKHRPIIMRELIARIERSSPAGEAITIVRPMSDAVLHFYRHRGFVRPDGSPPEMGDICFTNLKANPKIAGAVAALGQGAAKP